MDNKIKKLLEGFDENQIRQINRFLQSADGRRLKNSIGEQDKAKLLKQLESLDSKQVKNALSRLSAKDLSGIINKL